MPTNRKRTTRGRRGPPIDADDWAFLSDGTPKNAFTQFRSREYWQKLWVEHGAQITEEWAAKHPGTRPQHWWRFGAPRLPVAEHGEHAGWYYAPELIMPRLHLGGSGAPDPELTIHVYCLDHGLPVLHEGDFDPSDPPIWETQLAYLKRHGLLLPGEAKRAR